MPEPIITEPESAERADWNPAKPDTLARPTWWPAALGFAITLVAWGLITSNIVLAIGALAFAISVAGWIGEIRHERKQH